MWLRFLIIIIPLHDTVYFLDSLIQVGLLILSSYQKAPTIRVPQNVNAGDKIPNSNY